MEQDYNSKTWSRGCPNVDCKKTTCSCGIKYVYIPSSLGDDHEGSNVAPKNGAYSNAVVYYEANGAVYIYSCEGIPVETNISDANIMEEIAKLDREKADKETVETALALLQSTKADKVEVYDALALKQDKLTAGSGISIVNNVISNTRTTLPWGSITGQISDQTDLVNALSAKQDTIDSSHKLDADYIDDTNSINKFATAAQLSQISTNATNITDLQNNKQDVTDNSLVTVDKTITGAINEVDSIAKGANQALSYTNYQTMIGIFNAADEDEYNIGQNIYVVTLNVPDLWISSVESSSVTYTYTTDADFVNAIDTDGYVQVGYYRLSALETQEVDLTNYVEKDYVATSSRMGLVKPSTTEGMAIDQNGVLSATELSYSDYVSAQGSAFVSKTTLDNAITGKNLVSNTDYASSSKAGLIKIGEGLIYNVTTGVLQFYGLGNTAANQATIDAKSNLRVALTPASLDYAVKVGVTTNTNTLTGTEKNNAQTWLGFTTLTQAQYDALVSGGTVDANTYYFIEEE